MTANSSRDDSVKNSESDLVEQSRVNTIHLGVSGIPFPVYEIIEERTKNKEIVNKRELRLYEDDTDQLVVYSEKTEEEVLGLLYRFMPTPSMLEVFIDGLRLRDPQSKRRCEFIKGDPGAGKSFMAQLHSWMRTKQPPIVVDCGGKNLAELLYETVLDFESNKVPLEELEKRARSGSLHAGSMKSLKSTLSKKKPYKDIFSGFLRKETFKESWKSLWDRTEEKFYIENADGKGITILWDKVGKSPEAAEILRRSISQIMSNEGIVVSTNALGLVTRPGPLYRAFKEDRPIILDEYNKSKEGSDDCMQQVVQFLAGEIDEITITNSLKNKGEEGGISYTLRRQDMGINFFVTATGNAVEDGVTTRALSKSANSRWQPTILSKPTIEDWQHRWCQLLTGVPLSTLYHASKKQWDDKPSDFVKFLKNRLVGGLTENQIRAIPEHQWTLVQHWKEVLTFTDKMAQFCHKVGTLLDPDTTDFANLNFNEVIDEINAQEEYKNEASFDFRTIIKLMEEALHPTPKSKPVSQTKGFDIDFHEKKRDFSFQAFQPLVLTLGTNIVSALKKELLRISVQRGKNKTYQQFRVWGEQFGLFQTSEDESKQSLENHLNISPLDGYDLNSRAEIIQEQICAYLKEKHKDLAKSDNSNLLPLSQIKGFLTQLEANGEDEAQLSSDGSAKIVTSQSKKRFRLAQDDNGKTIFTEVQRERKETDSVANDNQNASSSVFVAEKEIFVINTDKKTLVQTPFMKASLNISSDETDKRKLVEQDVYLLSLVLPVLGTKNINETWVKNLSPLDGVTESEFDRSLKMAETQDTNFSTTTLMLDVGGQEKPLHIIRNNKSKRVLAVGESVSPHIQKLLTYARIDYVDRNDADAKRKITGALYTLSPTGGSVVEKELKLAFLLRNKSNDSIEIDMRRSLPDLLSGKDVEAYNRIYVRQNNSRKPIQPRMS